MRRVLGSLYPVLENRYYVDEFYNATVIRAVLWLSATFAAIDSRWVIDPVVNAIGRGAGRLAELSSRFDARFVDGAVHATARLADSAGRALRPVQTGKVQDYLLVVATTVLLLLGVFLYL